MGFTRLKIVYDADLQEPDNAFLSFIRGTDPVLVVRPGLSQQETLDLLVMFTDLHIKEGHKWPDELQILHSSDSPELLYLSGDDEDEEVRPPKRFGLPLCQLAGWNFSLN